MITFFNNDKILSLDLKRKSQIFLQNFLYMTFYIFFLNMLNFLNKFNDFYLFIII